MPISFASIEFRPLEGDTSYDKTLFEKYKSEYAALVKGVLFETDSMIAILYLVNGDVVTPVLVTYDLDGNKIDSLNLYENATGYSPDKEVLEYVTIYRDKKIKVADSIYTRQVDSTKVEGITKAPWSRKSRVYTHLILENGMILREKNDK